MSFNFISPENWQYVKLSSLGEVNRGRSRHRPRDAAHLYGGSYPFIQTGDVKASNGRINNYVQTYSEAGLQQSRLWPVGTMCITIAANIAETGILQFPACFPDSVIGFIPDPNKCDVFYIEYMFRLMRKRIQAQASGSVQDNINLQTLERIEFPIPTLNEQKVISSVLCTLDDKIQLNQQINQTLEQMAQAIFKSWFVDFEPVKAKIAALEAGGSEDDALLAAMQVISGKDPQQLTQLQTENPEHYATLRATAELFPAAMQESELGEIPEGWEVSGVSDFGKVITGKTPPKKLDNAYSADGHPFITPTDVDDSLFVTSTNRFLSEEGQRAIHKNKIEAGSICVTCIGSQMGKTTVAANDSYTNQQINSIVLKNSFCRNFLLMGLRARREEIFLIGSGGSTMPIINKSNFEKLKVLTPSVELIKNFESIVSPLINKILEGSNQNITLSEIRDTLLPKLLSGELSVN